MEGNQIRGCKPLPKMKTDKKKNICPKSVTAIKGSSLNKDHSLTYSLQPLVRKYKRMGDRPLLQPLAFGQKKSSVEVSLKK